MGGGADSSGNGAPAAPSLMIETLQPVRIAMFREEGRLSRRDSLDTVSTSATTNSSASTTDADADADADSDGGGGGSGNGSGSAGLSSKSLSSTRRRRHHTPKGLLNLGNTCYANAALQCLFATALPHALLDRKKAAVFRRYASNGHLLSLGSGSVDSEDCPSWHVGPGRSSSSSGGNANANANGQAGLLSHGTNTTEDAGSTTGKSDGERRERREARQKRREERLKEKEKKEQRELCRWLTGEMTALTKNYTARPAESKPDKGNAGQGGGGESFFGSIFGNASPPPPQMDAVDPGGITRNVHKLCKTLRPYQQEDAHEFLRALLSGLVMDGQNRELSSLFDGLLESAVTCQTCRYSSLTRDRYMDLSLDVQDRSVTDVPEALRHFTKTELLDEDNMVECGRCKEKRVVSKGLRIATAPTVLVIQLKRFAIDLYGRMTRLNKEVTYPLRLDIGECMSKANRSKPPPYELVGVLVHSGRTCDSGHYLSFVKSGRKWYKANDSVVSEVSEDDALSQKAYILVYEVAGMKAKHGCDSYHQYHRGSEENPSRGRSRGARDDSGRCYTERLREGKKSSVSDRNLRSHSAPRPVAHPEDDAVPALSKAHERVYSDGVAVRGGRLNQNRRKKPTTSDDTTDCFAFSSLFGLLDICGATANVVDDDKKRKSVRRESSKRSRPGRSDRVSSRNVKSEADSDADGCADPHLDETDGSQASESSAVVPSTPGSSSRLKKSTSSGNALDMEHNAAKAYGHQDRRKRASAAPDIAATTASGAPSDLPKPRGRSGSNSSLATASDCDSDVPSGVATDIGLGAVSEKGHRRATNLSRMVHRAASKTAGHAQSGHHSNHHSKFAESTPTKVSSFGGAHWGGSGSSESPRMRHRRVGSGCISSRGKNRSETVTLSTLPPLPNNSKRADE